MTICVVRRRPQLVPEVASRILTEAKQMGSEGIWSLRCLTVMPDHVHLLFKLGEHLTLPQCIARLKVKSKGAASGGAVTWQANFYDHRLRPDDSREETIRYIWLNPYRKDLLSPALDWPWFYCCPEDWAWFKGLTDHGHPFLEWIW